MYDFSGGPVIHFWPDSFGGKDGLMWMSRVDPADGCPVDQTGQFGYWDDEIKVATPEQLSWSVPTPPECEDIVLGGTVREIFKLLASHWLRLGLMDRALTRNIKKG